MLRDGVGTKDGTGPNCEGVANGDAFNEDQVSRQKHGEVAVAKGTVRGQRRKGGNARKREKGTREEMGE